MWGGTQETELLFNKIDCFSQRQAQLDGAKRRVDGLDDFDLAPDREQAAIETIVKEALIPVPVLDLENVEFEEISRRTTVRNLFGEHGERDIPFYLFDIPFDGDPDVFRIQPSSFTLNPPRGRIRGNILQIELRGPLEAGQIKSQYDDIVRSIQEYLSSHRQTWQSLEGEVRAVVEQVVRIKKQSMAASQSTASDLASLGFKVRK